MPSHPAPLPIGFLTPEAVPAHLTPEACDSYMGERTGCYEWRSVRYHAAAAFLQEAGLTGEDTLCDVGAGWTEWDYCLRRDYDWRGRYLHLDAGLLPLDLEVWTPHRRYDHFVALEVLEHLRESGRLLEALLTHARKAVVVSVPNPATVDVAAMDSTHQSAPDEVFFQAFTMEVQEATFYGGSYSQGRPDTLLATWKR